MVSIKLWITIIWWEITKRKDPLIKEALWDKTLKEYDNYYLLKKDWKLLGVKMYIDKTIKIQNNRDVTLTANSCLFINGRHCKNAFEVLL